MRRKTVAVALCTLLALGLMSCNEDDFLTETNPNELSAETYYQTEAQALSGVNAIYANLQSIGLYERRYFFIHDLLSNEAEGLPQLEGDLNQFNTYQVNAQGNPTLRENWDALYRGVQRANLVLGNVPNTPENVISEAMRSRLLAEARFLRAWFYYELVTQWGPVPLLRGTATQAQIPTGIPRAPRAEVYQLILEDLDFAEQNLPLRSEYASEDRGRVTAGAAAALKGKVHLFRSSTLDGVTAWAEAEAEFEKFVDGGRYAGEYRLMDTYFDNFTEEAENNAESIFEVQFTTTGVSWAEQGSGQSEATLRGQEYAFTNWQNTVPSRGLVEEYEDGDPRRRATLLLPGETYNGDQNTLPADADYPGWLKYTNLYKVETEPFANSGINFRVIRLADVLLSLADAKIELGEIDEAVALMNRVRARPSVDMPPYPTADYPVSNRAEALEALYHEIPVEFGGEQVFHKFQQRRPAYLEEWALENEEYRRIGGEETDVGFSLPTSILLPLPQSEIDANNALSESDQNPGY